MSSLPAWVDDLAGPDPSRGFAARVELYRAGCALVADIFAGWQKDAEFALLVAGQPIVGVAVPPEAFARIRLGWRMPPLASVPAELSTAEFELQAPGPPLDILTPVDNEGAIQKFLDRFGPGIQQVELPVKDVEEAARILATRFGLASVYPEAREGANGTHVNFLLVEKPGGGKVLIELFEAKR
jgi:hypothetical protein